MQQASGFKSGGANSLNFGNDIETSFPQEAVINGELGMKSDWLDGELRTNPLCFSTNMKINKTSTRDTRRRHTASYHVITNDSEGKGLDLLWSATDQLFVGANDSHLQTKITRDNSSDLTGENRTGRPQANTPKNKINLMVEYSIDVAATGTLALRADYNWTYERVGQLPDEEIDSYKRWNTRVTFTSADNH